MPYAITLALDGEAASIVVSMWRALAGRCIRDDALALGYAPHLTLAVFADDANLTRLLDATRDNAARWPAEPIILSSLGMFPGSLAGLFLAPIVTATLLARHTALSASLAGEPVDTHYIPGHWVPHVTLARDITDPAGAVAALDLSRLPFDATPVAMELVRFRPVTVLARQALIQRGQATPNN